MTDAEPAKSSARGRVDEIAALNQRIDDILAFQKERKPWWRDVATITAVAALILSLVSFGISIYRTTQEDLNKNRSDLRAAMQQFNTLSSSAAELPTKYRDNNGNIDEYRLGEALKTLHGQQNLIVKQAYSLVMSFEKYASADELINVGFATHSSGDCKAALDLYGSAVKNATTLEEYVTALRGRFIEESCLGMTKKARETLRMALSEPWKRFPGSSDNEFNFNATQALTYLDWQEAQPRWDCAEAKTNLEAARGHLSKLPSGLPMTSSLQAQLNRDQAFLNGLTTCPPL